MKKGTLMKKLMACIFALTLVSAFALSAQPDRREVRHGNRDFRKSDWKSAEIDYRKALVKDSLSFAANYNLANTLYRMGDYEQATKTYDAVKELAGGSPQASDWHFNAGNAAAQQENWEAAVAHYKESLLLNPGDIAAKENYIYAKGKLQEQQNNQSGGGQQDQQNDQNQDQNGDNGKDQNQDGQDNKDDQGQNNDDNGQNQDNQNDQQGQGDQNQGNGQPRPQPNITPQAAQQMLQAIQAKEKETQEKVKKEKAEALKSRQKEKNW